MLNKIFQKDFCPQNYLHYPCSLTINTTTSSYYFLPQHSMENICVYMCVSVYKKENESAKYSSIYAGEFLVT